MKTLFTVVAYIIFGIGLLPILAAGAVVALAVGVIFAVGLAITLIGGALGVVFGL